MISDRPHVFRNSAKAIIIKDNKLLAIEKKDEDGTWYLLPGGGQEFGEDLIAALKRECLEEIGAEIEVFDMVLCREYIGKNHEFSKTDSHFHQVEFYFRCQLLSNVDLSRATCLDTNQTGIRWLPLNDNSVRLYPKFLIDALNTQKKFTYYGDRN